ncbi:magnesium and cobalt transport protein CorA [Pseudonocardiaceae bacterium YIM PH 21723]|nr:magnesium and cobalt transport protein CorA [Pseudonocardiaceae bacterium YIM PH 21723]
MPSLPVIGLRGKGNGDGKTPAPSLPVPMSAYVVNCGVYVDGERLDGRWTHSEAIEEVRRRKCGFVWIGLHEPDEEHFNGIAQTFGLHPLAVEDAVHAHQRPKLERYDDTLFMVLKTVRYVAHESPTTANEIVETGEVMIFVGKDFIITVRHGRHAGLSAVRQQLEHDTEALDMGPVGVLHAIADQVVDTYLAVTEHIEEDIDILESEVFTPRSPVDAEQIYLMKREVMELRRAVSPLAIPLRRLSEGYSPLVSEQARSYFRDVDDHLTTVSERVASYDELLTTLVDAALAKITLQQNTDMRRISAWVAIISVPTMIAGIYGMNFKHMPELEWRYGYAGAIAVILVACFFLHRSFRRNGWL